MWIAHGKELQSWDISSVSPCRSSDKGLTLKTSALKLFAVANFTFINLVDNSEKTHLFLPILISPHALCFDNFYFSILKLPYYFQQANRQLINLLN